MHSTTALTIMKYLATEGLISVRMTTFSVAKFPQPIHMSDAREAFKVLLRAVGAESSDYIMGPTSTNGFEVWTRDGTFQKLFKVLYTHQKLYPLAPLERAQVATPELPSLFIGSEKTQVRQIPLTEEPPWPFRFLLELGGMIVCRPENHRDFILELRQFLNNHPQYRVQVDAKEWPDGSIAVFTWWFERLMGREGRRNVNVPERGRRDDS